jgi:DNA invertase Pin-like site-specific DNA recombinase
MLTLSARAIGYIRVSTEQQADSGLGLEAQQTSISGAALRLGLELSRRC